MLFVEMLLMALQDPLRIYEALKGSHVAWWGLRRLYGSPRALGFSGDCIKTIETLLKV